MRPWESPPSPGGMTAQPAGSLEAEMRQDGAAMRAVVRDAYGSVDVLRLAEVDKPVAGDGEVLVRVHAAGVDQGVWHLMVGMPYVMRLAGFGIRAPKNPLLGYDVAGRVEAVGTNAGSFRPGDEVFGTCRGSFAEYAVARADRLASKPDSVSFEEAAAVPISGYAALRAAALSPFVRQKLGFLISKERSQDLEELRKLLEAGAIKPIVDRTFPLDDVPTAIRYLRDGQARGKIVITT